MATLFPIFDPEKLPIAGMLSFPAAIALRPGEFPLFQNWRWDERTMYVRDGCVKLTSGVILASGVVCGAKTLSVNGTETTFVALRASSKTSVFKTTDGSTFTEITASSGQYGDTRFDTSGDVTFCIIRHPIVYSAVDKVLMQNGADTPRVYDGTNTVKLAAIVQDDTMRDNPVQMAPYRYFTISNPSNTDYATAPPTGAGITMADTGSSPDNKIRLTITTAVTNGSTATVILGSGTGTPNTAGKQLWLVCDSTYFAAFQRLKVEFGTNSGYLTVWDPYTASSPEPYYANMDALGTLFLVAFDLQAAGLYPTTSYDRIRFTWGGDSTEPTATVTLDILAIGISGTDEEPGQCRIGFAYMNSGSRGESPGTIFNNYEPVKIRDMGGPAQNHQRIPNEEGLYFKYTIPLRNGSDAMKDAGVDLITVYKAKPGQPWPLYVDAKQIGTYTPGSPGSWAHTSGSASSALTHDVSASGIGDFRLPSAFHIPVPVSKSCYQGNGRVFAATVSDGSTRRGVYVSSAENQFRFLKQADSSEGEETPFSFEIPGEIPQGFASLATSTFGSAAIYPYTDRAVYMIGGYQASELARISRIGPHGTLAPATILEHKDAIFWVDQEWQVMAMQGGQIVPISRERVDDIFKAVPANRLTSLCAGVYNDRLYFGHSIAAGTTNVSALVFNTIRNAWEADDLYPGALTVERFAYLGGTSPKFLAFSSDANCYQIEQPALTTDLGSNIATSWMTPYYHGILGFGEGFLFNTIKIFGDKKTSLSWNASIEYQPDALVSTKVVDMAGASGIKWGLNDMVIDAGQGGGIAAQLTLTGNAPGGTRIYGVFGELEEVSIDASA